MTLNAAALKTTAGKTQIASSRPETLVLAFNLPRRGLAAVYLFAFRFYYRRHCLRSARTFPAENILSSPSSLSPAGASHRRRRSYGFQKDVTAPIRIFRSESRENLAWIKINDTRGYFPLHFESFYCLPSPPPSPATPSPRSFRNETGKTRKNIPAVSVVFDFVYFVVIRSKI